MGVKHENNGDLRSESEEKREQTIFILDFWKRLAPSYHPEGKSCVSDAGGKNIVLDQPDINWTLDQTQNVSKEEAIKLKRTMANLELLSFLDE